MLPTEEARQLIFNLLSSKPNKTFPVVEFREYLTEHASQPITSNCVTSALDHLVSKYRVIRISRGLYKFNPDFGKIDTLIPKALAILKDTYTKISEVPNCISILEVHEKDIDKLRKIKTLTDDIKKLMDSFDKDKTHLI